MKLILQKKLHFKDNKSDKVYEVDLCEVSQGQYVVNFRYGKRGSVLKDGTKTVSSVNYESANRIFYKLVDSKLKKGYKLANNSSPAQNKTPQPNDDEVPSTEPWVAMSTETEDSARKRGILRRLYYAAHRPKHPMHKKWKVSRVVWRAGLFKYTEATPYLLMLAQESNTEMDDYNILWAIGRCSEKNNAEAIEILNSKLTKTISNICKRAARQSLFMLSPEGETREALVQHTVAQLPSGMQKQLESEQLSLLLRDYTQNRKKSSFEFLVGLSMIQHDYPFVRKALENNLIHVPLKPGFFKYIRHTFKAAEQSDNALTYGTIAYLFDKTKGNFRMPRYSYGSVWHNRRYVRPHEELKKSNSSVAYSDRTHGYMKKRVLKHLNHIAEYEPTLFVKVATAILLNYDDSKDKKWVREDKRWKYDYKKRKWISTSTFYSAHSHLEIFNELLYKNSSRFGKGLSGWAYINNHKEDSPTPKEREEWMPELWDSMPKALVHLLMRCKSEAVAEFAYRAFNENPLAAALKQQFTLNDAKTLFEAPTDTQNLLGLDIARRLYNPNRPDSLLIALMLKSNQKDVRHQAMYWIEQSLSTFLQNTDFIFNMLTHSKKDIRTWMRGQLFTAVKLLTPEQKQVLVGRLFSHVLSLDEKNTLANEINDILLQHFNDDLQSVSMEVLNDLIDHKSKHLKWLGAKLLKERRNEVDIPMDKIHKLLTGTPSIQSIGKEILLSTSDTYMIQQREELWKWAYINKTESVREVALQRLTPLVQGHVDIAQWVMYQAIAALLRKEPWEGLHQAVYTLVIKDPIQEHLKLVERGLIFRLLNVDYRPSQELACLLIERYVSPESLSVRNIVRLADHEALKARQLAWSIYNNHVARMKYEKEEALRLLDAKWDDSRAFAFDYFRNQFTDQDWTPSLLISICDSVRPDVQALGRELVTRHFTEDAGHEYLTKLSQHPRPELQLFATNYLERFAANNVARQEELRLYFITVLSQVNKGRVAKERVMNFLYKEAQKEHDSAVLFASLLDRLSATDAIQDKAKAIFMMRNIHQQYPNIEVPLQMQDFPTYENV